MFKFISAVSVVLFLFTPLFSQGQRKAGNSSGFRNGYFSGSYSYGPSFMEKINEEVSGFGLDEFDDNMYLYGFELHGNFNPAFGIGIKYLTGDDLKNSKVTLEGFTDSSGEPLELERSVEAGLSLYGLSLSYRKYMAGKIEFFGALGASYGSAEIIISQDYGDQTFEEIWDGFIPDSGLDSRYNKSVSFTSGLWMLEAENGIRFFATSRVAAGVSVAYTQAYFNSKAEINNGFESVLNVPDLDYSGFTYKATLYFGY
ncbi:MAG: hypothetical protein JXN63_05280 [Candidatus Delongbacteria bacterium]|nr:hypothetical protein [Candidatus Delongbacteria bacterium]